MLKKALDDLKPTILQNLKSGFRKAEIYTINKDEILNPLLDQDHTAVDTGLIVEVFLARLNDQRIEITTKSNKRKKLALSPDWSINPDDIECVRVQMLNKLEPKPPRKMGKRKQRVDSFPSLEDDNFSLASSGRSMESFLGKCWEF